MKRVLILGGFGFIGTNIINEMLNRGNYEIIVFELKNIKVYDSDLFDSISVYYGDFNNEKDYEIIFNEKKIDMVIHLISSTVPSNSNENIVYDINANLTNTINLLEIMKKHGVKKIIFPSSGGTIYGPINEKLKETYPTNPICSHGIIKLTIEKYIQLYKYLHDINYLILRIANPFGEYHKSMQQGLINVVLRKILKGEKVEIWGSGEAVRDYIYIQDVVKIIVNLIDKGVMNEIINIGSGEGHSINDIVSIIKEEIGTFDLEYKDKKKHDLSYVVLDNEKLKSFINPTFIDLNEAIIKTYLWQKNALIKKQ